MTLRKVGRAIRWIVGGLFAVVTLPLAATVVKLGFVQLGMISWFGFVLAVIGVRVRLVGPEPPPGSLVVMNHVSYLDPVIFGALVPGRFLAKSEIAHWPILGFANRWGNTIFVERTSPRRSRELVNRIASYILKGDRVLLFAEGGIVAQGDQVASFRPMLFEACIQSGRPAVPVALRHVTPSDPEVWRWHEGSMFMHLVTKLFPADLLEVEVCCGPALIPGIGETRKTLAARAYEEVVELCGNGDSCPVPPPSPDTLIDDE